MDWITSQVNLCFTGRLIINMSILLMPESEQSMPVSGLRPNERKALIMRME